MGKKKKTPKPGADGILRTGIYQRRVTPKKMAGDELGAALDQWADEANRPASEHLQAIRDSLKQIAMPFLDGPCSDQQTHAGRIRVLDVGEGPQRFSEKPDLDEQARDAIEALEIVRAVAHNLDGNQDLLFRTTLRLGRLLERIGVRQFEPLVALRKRSDEAIDKINRNRPTAETLKRDAKEAIEKAKLEYPSRSSDANFIKTKAAESLGIQKRALNTRLSK